MEELKLQDFDQETDCIDKWDPDETSEIDTKKEGPSYPLLFGGAILLGIVCVLFYIYTWVLH